MDGMDNDKIIFSNFTLVFYAALYQCFLKVKKIYSKFHNFCAVETALLTKLIFVQLREVHY